VVEPPRGRRREDEVAGTRVAKLAEVRDRTFIVGGIETREAAVRPLWEVSSVSCPQFEKARVAAADDENRRLGLDEARHDAGDAADELAVIGRGASVRNRRSRWSRRRENRNVAVKQECSDEGTQFRPRGEDTVVTIGDTAHAPTSRSS
jgi:hypothetical protein